MSPQLWQKIKPWLIQVTLFSSIGLLIWLGIFPLRGLIRGEMDKLQQMDVLREHEQEQLKALPELGRQQALIDEQGGALNMILTKDDLVGFIQQLEALARQESVAIEITSKDNTLLESKITPADKDKKGKKLDADTDVSGEKKVAKSLGKLENDLLLKKYIRLSILVRAPYKQMVSYLYQLETMPYALDVLGLNVREMLDEGSSPSLAGDVNIVSSDQAAAPVPVEEDELKLDTTIDLALYLKD